MDFLKTITCRSRVLYRHPQSLLQIFTTVTIITKVHARSIANKCMQLWFNALIFNHLNYQSYEKCVFKLM